MTTTPTLDMSLLVKAISEVQSNMPNVAQLHIEQFIRENGSEAQGMLNPDWREGGKRFEIGFHSHDPDDEPAWRYKLGLTDFKYLDSDSLPITAIAAGKDYEDAFKRACQMMTEAWRTKDRCIFA